jgi:hypothetical protein
MLNLLNGLLAYVLVFGVGYCFGAYKTQTVLFFTTAFDWVKSWFVKQ